MAIKGKYAKCKNKLTNQRVNVFYTITVGFNCAVITIYAKHKQSKGFSFMMNGHVRFLSFKESKYETIIKLEIDTTQFKYPCELCAHINDMFSYC